MAFTSFPFDGQTNNEAEWRKMSRLWAIDGIDPDDPAGTLAISINGGGQIVVGAGSGWCDAAYVANGAAVTLTPATNSSGSTRVDRVVLRYDGSANSVTAALVTGTPGSSPQPPALTRSRTGVWEQHLARYTVATGGATATLLVDERQYLVPGGGLRTSSAQRVLLTYLPAGVLVTETDTTRLWQRTASGWQLDHDPGASAQNAFLDSTLSFAASHVTLISPLPTGATAFTPAKNGPM